MNPLIYKLLNWPHQNCKRYNVFLDFKKTLTTCLAIGVFSLKINPTILVFI